MLVFRQIVLYLFLKVILATRYDRRATYPQSLQWFGLHRIYDASSTGPHCTGSHV